MNKFYQFSFIFFGLLLLGAGCNEATTNDNSPSDVDLSTLNNTEIICCQFSNGIEGTSTERACAEYEGTIVACK